ncbi:NACHT, LRR and PYD domains-containing protein 1-like [Dermochelys coriacea]|uniref:NACHT, LRR and PYD domains-containing protein 1-like n=1 Tax=Dermochelys coriacea TaxID=27794 RepID=UPI001CA8FCD3|nr:NACHT, LRR and PYD domains-containing protein 1-like [Dermochelys coriacea]
MAGGAVTLEDSIHPPGGSAALLQTLLKALKGHFVDWHREQLIQRVSNVEAVCRKMLSTEQCRSIVTDPLKMWKLYKIVPSWNTWQKNRLYQALKKTNRALVEELEGKCFVDRHREQLIQRVSQVNKVLNFLHGKVLNRKQYQNIRTKTMNPEIMWRLVHLPRAGSFRCSETELGFEVIAAVTIQYGYDSWDRRLSTSEKQQWMVSSPLFNIRVEPARAMAAVHLPHFLCLAAAEVDISQLQVAHFADWGMTLESPTWVRPFHAVLENPSFSPIGLLWKQIYSKLFPPIHTLVLLYRSSRAADITLHLYLIPSDLSLAQAIEDNEMKYQSIRVRKPSKSKPLYFGSCSFVSSPSKIEVTPKELEFSNMAVHPLDPDMEIYTKDLGGKLELSLVEKKTQQQIWETTVRAGDVKLPGSTPTRAGNIQDKMAKTLRDALQETLDELDSKNVKRFKSRLNNMELAEGYKRIPNGMLEETDTLAVCDLLVQYYKMEGAVEVAIQALKGINQNELAGKLETDTRRIPAGTDSICSRFSAVELGSPI